MLIVATGLRDQRRRCKALLLCLVCGLRRSEADWILWSSFDPDRNQIHVEATEFHRLKSAESARVIDLPPTVSQFLQTERAETPGRFILTGNDNPSRKSRCYRANPTFRFLSAWLKRNGVADRKPIHVLRKEIGSLIASPHFSSPRCCGLPNGIPAAFRSNSRIHGMSAYRSPWNPSRALQAMPFGGASRRDS